MYCAVLLIEVVFVAIAGSILVDLVMLAVENGSGSSFDLITDVVMMVIVVLVVAVVMVVESLF
jgi:hypothetical protein